MKKIFRIFICIQVVLTICSVLNKNVVLASDTPEDSTYYENCNLSMQVFNDAITPFKVNNKLRSVDSNFIYTNNYAGCFIDDKGILNIGFLESEDFSSYEGHVQYIQREFSYNYLKEVKEAISDKMIEYGVNMVGLDEKLNQIKVYVPSQSIANNIIMYLQNINLYNKNAVDITVDPNNYVVPHSRTVYGGEEVSHSLSSGTICVNAYDNDTGQYGVLTNAHVALSNMQMYCNDGFIGVASKRQEGGTIDAAFVPFDDNVNWDIATNAKVKSMPSEIIYDNIRLGNREDIVTGLPVIKLGKSTKVTTGRIIYTDYDCHIGEGEQKKIIKNAIKYSNESQHGDSGGPVYLEKGDGNLYLIAMTFAGPDPSYTSEIYGVGCNIFDVMDKLNITPILRGSFFDTTDLSDTKIRIDKLVPRISLSSSINGIEFKIPSNINDKEVTEINDGAFFNQHDITNFILPDKLEKIGNSAFEACYYLRNMTLPNSVTSIGSSAFKGCNSLSSITIPDTITDIAPSTFESCCNLNDIIIPNGVTNIGSSAFKECIKLTNISIPNKVTIIAPSTFESCYELNDIIIPNGVTSIGSFAFGECHSLTRIEIPSNVEYVGEGAFQDCKKLQEVYVQREISDIPNLGKNAFDGCNINLEIVVPQNRIAEYKNKAYWSDYKNKIIPSNFYFDEIYLDCFSNDIFYTTIQRKYNKIYKLNVECSKVYKFTSTGPAIVKMNIYDSNMILVSSGEGVEASYLGHGTYYIDLCFASNTVGGKITTSCGLSWPNEGYNISYGLNNDVLTHFHKINETECRIQLIYQNTKNADFYEFKVIGDTDDNTNIVYQGDINIYKDSDRTMLVGEFPLSNDNRVLAYLPENRYYYIDIVMPNDGNFPTDISITKEEQYSINLNGSLSSSTFDEIFSTKQIGNYFKKVVISHRSSLTLDALMFEAITKDIPVLVYKQIYDEELNTYVLETVLSEKISNINRCPQFKLNVDGGIYYFGYLNNTDGVRVTYALTRNVNNNGLMCDLVTDPAKNEGYELGSEVNFNHGLCDTYTITEGFTRNIYLMVEDRLLQPISRLDYDWYSSNDNIASVTNYGTVLAKSVDEPQEVIIYAILKKDPSIIYQKTFTILNDTSEEVIEINCEMSYSYTTENGKYKLELDNLNSPYPMIQYYDWQIFVPFQETEISVVMDYWGLVTSSGVGTVIISGIYTFNPRVKIVINLTITQ